MSTNNTSLEKYGIKNTSQIFFNLSVPVLIEHCIKHEEGELTSTGALTTRTYERTGRSPNDKLVVKDKAFEDQIWWGPVNKPMDPGTFDLLFRRVQAYLQNRPLYVFDGYAGADETNRLPIRVINEYAWHNLFVHQLFLRPTPEQLETHVPEFTIISAPGFRATPDIDNTNSDVFICLSLEKRIVLIGGTHYAGEMKKSIFTVMNYLMPQKGVLPMHCSANIGEKGDTALFFGLSGTGKTTLSADPNRKLIGDDEHGWTDTGIFNFEGGCYAKCIHLTPEREPEIYAAIRFGSVLENVVVEHESHVPDYESDAITENTRAAYPIDYISNAELSGLGGHPKTVVFLTADAFGVLPPIAKLTNEQAMYHFLSGYTSRLAGTELGVTEPSPVFSSCFGQPFLPLHPTVYAELLGEKLAKHGSTVYLVNTGWTGGPYGEGERMSLPYTRAMITAVLNGDLENVEYETHPVFGVQVPKSCPGVPAEVLNPRNTWKNKEAYDKAALELAARFQKNFEKFGEVSETIKSAGPKVGAGV